MAEDENFAPHADRHGNRIYTLSGALAWYQQELVLMVEGGGYWFLEGPSSLYRYIGACVMVEGKRYGFNRIDVERFKPDGADWLPENVVMRAIRHISLFAKRS
jgi:hypothetical protein